MKLGILSKRMLLGVLLTLIPTLLIWGVNIYEADRSLTFAAEETRALAYDGLGNTVEGIVGMLQSQQEVLEQVVEADLNVAFELAKEYGGLRLDEGQWRWNAVNQFTKESVSVSLPQMYLGERPIRQLSSFSSKSDLVDDIGRIVGGTCTIFQRINEAGDMLRVATNVKKLDGDRATGTYIPAVNPDGKPNPVIAAVMSGKRFVGRAFVVNAWYVTAYEPFYQGDKIIGVLYYGVREDSATSLRRQIEQLVVAESGGVFVMDSKGKLIISMDGTDEGDSILDRQDAAGQPYIQKIVEAATALGEGQTADVRYPLSSRSGQPEMQLAMVSYFKKWDWIIVAQAPESELFTLVTRLATMNSDNQRKAIYILLGSLLFIALVWYYTAGRFVRPIKQATSLAQALAAGDLDAKISVAAKDEIRDLANALSTMAGNLRNTIHEVEEKSREAEKEAEACRLASEEAEEALQKAEQAKREGMIQASERIQSVSESLSAASRQFADRVDQANEGVMVQSQRAEETATAMEEMNNAVIEVARNASSAASSSDEAKDRAQQGADVVSQVVQAITQVHNKAQELKTNMDDLDQQTEAIGQVMNVITDIADQTNLLALNAAIEAARAGEAGRGFAVVADEVRKLAEKTMAATKEVGNTIAGIQNGTRANVQNVEQAVELVDKATKLANQSGESLREIVSLVENVSDQVRSIATASEEQSATSEEINRSFDEINRISKDTASIMSEAAEAVNRLSDLTESLGRLVTEMRQA
jgi:methyl-accepting chemotaxis protein